MRSLDIVEEDHVLQFDRVAYHTLAAYKSRAPYERAVSYLSLRSDDAWGTEIGARENLCSLMDPHVFADLFILLRVSRIEIEERLSQEEYIALMVEADPDYRAIHKERYCLSENGLYYEIDIYPEWKEHAVMAIELYSEDQEIVFPEGIDVIREVTGDPAYSNHELARIK